MDIKKKIEEVVKKIKDDKDFEAKFKKDPVDALERILGIDLPNDQIEKIIDGVKAKISIDDIGDKLGDIGEKLGGLFGKK